MGNVSVMAATNDISRSFYSQFLQPALIKHLTVLKVFKFRSHIHAMCTYSITAKQRNIQIYSVKSLSFLLMLGFKEQVRHTIWGLDLGNNPTR